MGKPFSVLGRWSIKRFSAKILRIETYFCSAPGVALDTNFHSSSYLLQVSLHLLWNCRKPQIYSPLHLYLVFGVLGFVFWGEGLGAGCCVLYVVSHFSWSLGFPLALEKDSLDLDHCLHSTSTVLPVRSTFHFSQGPQTSDLLRWNKSTIPHCILGH